MLPISRKKKRKGEGRVFLLISLSHTYSHAINIKLVRDNEKFIELSFKISCICFFSSSYSWNYIKITRRKNMSFQMDRCVDLYIGRFLCAVESQGLSHVYVINWKGAFKFQMTNGS